MSPAGVRTLAKFARLGLASSCGALLACGVEPRSCDLDSEAIVMHATVTDADHGVEVEIELAAAGDDDSPGTPLTLCVETGEQLRVNGRATKQVRALGHVYYTLEFADPEATYTIEYERDDETITLELAMPPTFEILAPSEDEVIPRSQPIDVEWTPTWPDHTIAIGVEDRVGSDCLEGLGYSTEVDDLGSATIGAYMIEAGTADVESCKAWVAITRTTIGSYSDSLHEGGSVEGYVKRRRRFVSSG